MTQLDDTLAALADIPRDDVLRVREAMGEMFEGMDGATDRQMYNFATRNLPAHLGLDKGVVKRVVLKLMGYERPPRAGQ